MVFDPETYHRRSIRLRGYDYSQDGVYFLTICTHRRACLLGEIVEGEMVLNEAGLIVAAAWEQLPCHYPHAFLDSSVIMPNHVHSILALNRDSTKRAGLKPAPTLDRGHGLPEIVRGFKTFSSRRINEFQRTRGKPVWQRNYYEHIIRDRKSLNAIREYIESNPSQWGQDPENPAVFHS
jgi:putative transposase